LYRGVGYTLDVCIVQTKATLNTSERVTNTSVVFCRVDNRVDAYYISRQRDIFFFIRFRFSDDYVFERWENKRWTWKHIFTRLSREPVDVLYTNKRLMSGRSSKYVSAFRQSARAYITIERTCGCTSFTEKIITLSSYTIVWRVACHAFIFVSALNTPSTYRYVRSGRAYYNWRGFSVDGKGPSWTIVFVTAGFA